MITIQGRELWRGGEKIGWVDDRHVFAHDGRKLGYFDDKHVWDMEGRKLAYVEGDHLWAEAGSVKIPMEKIEENVEGMAEYPLEKSAIYILLGS